MKWATDPNAWLPRPPHVGNDNVVPVQPLAAPLPTTIMTADDRDQLRFERAVARELAGDCDC